MKLREFDLYVNGFIESFFDGERYIEREEIQYNGSDSDRFHTINEIDTLTKIAAVKYKDDIELPHQYWWVIADANNILNPMDLTDLIGTEILIPDIFLFLINI